MCDVVGGVAVCCTRMVIPVEVFGVKVRPRLRDDCAVVLHQASHVSEHKVDLTSVNADSICNQGTLLAELALLCKQI